MNNHAHTRREKQSEELLDVELAGRSPTQPTVVVKVLRWVWRWLVDFWNLVFPDAQFEDKTK